jgi:hypothetical protein
MNELLLASRSPRRLRCFHLSPSHAQSAASSRTAHASRRSGTTLAPSGRESFRKIPRDVHEDARDATRALMGTPEFVKSRNERKKVEMRFAHLKTHHGFERMRLRGLSGARDEFHLAAIVQNLKTLANYIWRPWLNVPAACLA